MNEQLISFKTSVVIVGVMFATFMISSPAKPPVVIKKVKTVTVYKDKIIHPEIPELTKENVMSYLKELNVKFPHIVLAQAIIESGTFTSKICKKNNNLFGMREARLRISNNLGTQFGQQKVNIIHILQIVMRQVQGIQLQLKRLLTNLSEIVFLIIISCLYNDNH